MDGPDNAEAEVAEAIRQLAAVLARGDHPPHELAAVAARLRELTSAFSADAVAGAPTAWARHMSHQAAAAEPSTAADSQGAHPLHAGVSGVFPPLTVTVDGNTLAAETSFGEAYEGPPGLVHGGFLAAGFDIVLSQLALLVLNHSVTRWLRFRYLGPVFLHQNVRYEVEADPPEGRLVLLRGTALADGKVALRAEAQFVAMDLGRFADRSSTIRS